MVVTLEVSPELESRLKRAAQFSGQDTAGFILDVLESRLAERKPRSEELWLIEQISKGLPEQTWQKFDELRQVAKAEEMSPDQQQELIAITDQIEAADALRLEHLASLAQLRGVPIAEVMLELGIEPRFDG